MQQPLPMGVPRARYSQMINCERQQVKKQVADSELLSLHIMRCDAQQQPQQASSVLAPTFQNRPSTRTCEPKKGVKARVATQKGPVHRFQRTKKLE